jgi:uncharacterized membrane protein
MATTNTIAERAASAAAYLPLVGRIILMFLPTRRSPGVRFHVFQATLFGFVSTLLLGGLFCCRHVHYVGYLLKPAAVVDLMLLIALASAAFLARPIALPVLGSISRKLAEVSNVRQALQQFAGLKSAKTNPSRSTTSPSITGMVRLNIGPA